MGSSRHRLACFFGATLVVWAAYLGNSAPLGAQDHGIAGERQVPFLTLRNPTGSDVPGAVFGDARSGLSAGWYAVRDVDLRALAPLAQIAPAFMREDLLRVDNVVRTDSARLFDALTQGASDHAPAIYVHGYYISFDKGCRRAVLLQENAGLAGRFLWFSWPSDGALAYYTHDESDLYWSIPDLANTILETARRFGSDVVDVMGHSLGARGVVLALYEVANRAPDIRLDQVVLLAPDMDFGIFERILPRIRPIAENITIYVTRGDHPLALSAQLHGYPRLGEAGNDVAVLGDIEVVDLSALPSNSPTGHLYHIYSADVGRDLGQLLNQGLKAADRSNLRQVGPNLWSMQPSSPQPGD